MNVVIDDTWGRRGSGNVFVTESNSFLSYQNGDSAPVVDSNDPIQLYSGSQLPVYDGSKPNDKSVNDSIYNISFNQEQPTSINEQHARLYKQHKHIESLGDVKSDEDCSVCLSSDANCAAEGCGHVFHSGCVMRWLRTNVGCPVCRSTVENLKPLLVDTNDSASSSPVPMSDGDDVSPPLSPHMSVDMSESSPAVHPQESQTCDEATALELNPKEGDDISEFLDVLFEGTGDLSHRTEVSASKGMAGLEVLDDFLPLGFESEFQEQLSGGYTQPHHSVPYPVPPRYPPHDQVAYQQQMQYPGHYGAPVASYYPPHGAAAGNDEQPNIPPNALCSICFKPSVEVMVNPCRHVYHGSCVRPMLEASVGDCPLCRTPIVGFSPVSAEGRAENSPTSAASLNAASLHYKSIFPRVHGDHWTQSAHPQTHHHAHGGYSYNPYPTHMNPSSPVMCGGYMPSHAVRGMPPMSIQQRSSLAGEGSARHPLRGDGVVAPGSNTGVAAGGMTLLDRKRKHDLTLAARGKRSSGRSGGGRSGAGTGGGNGTDAKKSKSQHSPDTVPASPSDSTHSATSSTSVTPCCTCTNGCRNTRCPCVKATGVCGPNCGCSTCKNPFRAMVEAGINLDDVKEFADECLMQNLSKVKNMPAKLKTIVSTDCCKVKMTLAEAVAGVDCSKCGDRFVYSWCWGKLCSVKRRPRNHCKTCKHCGDHRNVHCMHCGMCYFAGVGSGMSCTCKDTMGMNMAGVSSTTSAAVTSSSSYPSTPSSMVSTHAMKRSPSFNRSHSHPHHGGGVTATAVVKQEQVSSHAATTTAESSSPFACTPSVEQANGLPADAPQECHVQ